MDFDFNYLLAQWPALLDGVQMTLRVSVLAIVCSLLIGVLGGAARVMKVPVLAQVVALYVELIRNTPILVQLFFIFYGLPAIGMGLSLFWSGCCACRSGPGLIRSRMCGAGWRLWSRACVKPASP